MFPNEPKKLLKELSRIVGNKKKDNAVPPHLPVTSLMNSSPI